LAESRLLAVLALRLLQNHGVRALVMARVKMRHALPLHQPGAACRPALPRTGTAHGPLPTKSWLATA